MNGRKRHGGRRANRGTQPVGPFTRRVTRAGRKAIADAIIQTIAGITEAPTLLPDGSIVITIDSQGGTMADFRRTVATIGGKSSPILARYDREIAHARSRGLHVTAERIAAERDEYREAGQ